MKIKEIRTLWPENESYRTNWANIGNEYIFVYFHTPVLIETKQGTTKTKSGTIILYDKFSPKKYAADGVPLMHDWMHITGDLSALMGKCSFAFGEPYVLKNGNFVTKMMQELEREFCRKDKYSPQITENLLSELFLKISRQLETQNEFSINSETEKKLTALRVKMYQNYEKHWDTEQMAKSVSFSPSRFYALYKKLFGISPKQDLQQIRIEHAKILLTQHDITIRKVSELIGYENEYYFIRKFKEITGRTPQKYKKELERKINNNE